MSAVTSSDCTDQKEADLTDQTDAAVRRMTIMTACVVAPSRAVIDYEGCAGHSSV